MDVSYQFGEFELDVARIELRHRGMQADVQPKMLRLLLHLIQHRDRVVSNDELLRELWPEEAVGPGSIKRAIRGVRHALGDRADAETCIRTVRGFGYQFIADVVVHEGTATAEPSPVPAAVHAHTRDELLGREGVMDLLHDSLQQALSGSCRCVLITGGPGLGKTRTVEALLAHARELGADAWFGRCTEVEGAPAFWPIIQVLREALRDRGAVELRALMGSEGADIAGAISELREQLPDLPEAAPLSSASARFRLFDSMAVFLRRAADKRPIVLALDDLHRADPASLRLLVFVLRQMQRARILIVGAFRPDPPDAPETAQLLEELMRESSSRCVALQGLSEREIARYIEHTTGSEPPASVIALLHAQTAGNPLFMHHLIENWRAAADRQSPPFWHSLASTRPSQGLAGAIERHLELVSPACRELLRVAAVLGTEFSAGVAARIADQTAADSSERLAEATASGLVREIELGRHRFAHVLVRDALYSQLSAAERAALHHRAACAIEAQGIGDNSVLLSEAARHFVLAAPHHDPDRALLYTLRSAEAALRTLAYEQAAADFERALDLLQYQPPDASRRMSLLFRKGDALARFDLPAARAALFEAAALARQLGDGDILARAAALIASRPETGTVDAAQVALLRQALAMLLAHDAHDERGVLLQALIAKSLIYATDDSQERVSLARDALIKARRLTGVAQRAEALSRCHEALPGPEHLQERLGISTELMRLAHQTGEPVRLMGAFAVQIEICVERGDMQSVDTALDSIDVLAERVREPFYRWYGKVARAMRNFVQGDIMGSDRRLEEALQGGAPISPELLRHIYCIQKNAAMRMRGQVRETESIVREMMLQFPKITGWSAAWGALCWDLGQHDEARRSLERLMVRGAARARTESSGLATCVALSELCCKVGDATAARDIYTVMAPYADHHAFTDLGASTYGPVSRHLASLAECQGDAQLAETHYRAALAAVTRMGSPVFTSGTSSLYARMLLRSGDARRRVQAAELLSSAHQIASKSQLHALVTVCRGFAERYGIRLDRPGSEQDHVRIPDA